jgi:hypothetical protein
VIRLRVEPQALRPSRPVSSSPASGLPCAWQQPLLLAWTSQRCAAPALLTSPLWVNLAILVPLLAFTYWRRRGLSIRGRTLTVATAFGIAFGFVEAEVFREVATIVMLVAVALLAARGARERWAISRPADA